MSSFRTKTVQKVKEFLGTTTKTKDTSFEKKRHEIGSIELMMKNIKHLIIGFTNSLTNIATFNISFSSELGKIYDKDCPYRGLALLINETIKTHEENIKEQVAEIQKLNENFKEWFIGFERLKGAFKSYEEKRQKYDHYSKKIEKLRQRRANYLQKNHADNQKEMEKLQRNEKKYEDSKKSYDISLFNTVAAMDQVLRTRFDLINPVISRFLVLQFQTASKITKTYTKLSNIEDEFKHIREVNPTVDTPVHLDAETEAAMKNEMKAVEESAEDSIPKKRKSITLSFEEGNKQAPVQTTEAKKTEEPSKITDSFGAWGNNFSNADKLKQQSAQQKATTDTSGFGNFGNFGKSENAWGDFGNKKNQGFANQQGAFGQQQTSQAQSKGFGDGSSFNNFGMPMSQSIPFNNFGGSGMPASQQQQGGPSQIPNQNNSGFSGQARRGSNSGFGQGGNQVPFGGPPQLYNNPALATQQPTQQQPQMGQSNFNQYGGFNQMGAPPGRTGSVASTGFSNPPSGANMGMMPAMGGMSKNQRGSADDDPFAELSGVDPSVSGLNFGGGSNSSGFNNNFGPPSGYGGMQQGGGNMGNLTNAMAGVQMNSGLTGNQMGGFAGGAQNPAIGGNMGATNVMGGGGGQFSAQTGNSMGGMQNNNMGAGGFQGGPAGWNNQGRSAGGGNNNPFAGDLI